MLDNSIINPYVRVAMRSILRKGTWVARRIIFDYELIYIAEGELVLNYAKVDHKCTKGQFILLRPGVSHSFSVIKENVSQPHIHFDITHMSDSPHVPICFKDITELEKEERRKIRNDIFKEYPQNPFITFSNHKDALELFYEIVNHPKPSSLSQKGFLVQLLDMMIEDNFPEALNNATDSFYSIEDQVKAYLDAGQGLSFCLEDITNQFNYSKYYLERRFKERYGISLMAYRNNKRMQLAKILLQTESVSAVADKLGFSSIYVFSRAFKNHFGVSPTESAKAR